MITTWHHLRTGHGLWIFGSVFPKIKYLYSENSIDISWWIKHSTSYSHWVLMGICSCELYSWYIFYSRLSFSKYPTHWTLIKRQREHRVNFSLEVNKVSCNCFIIYGYDSSTGRAPTMLQWGVCLSKEPFMLGIKTFMLRYNALDKYIHQPPYAILTTAESGGQNPCSLKLAGFFPEKPCCLFHEITADQCSQC